MSNIQLIAHRCNTIALLHKVAPQYGVEIDIRTQADQLIINHEPYLPGELFTTWLEHYHHNLLVLNVKEAGLEERIISALQARNITNYFFLDQAFPCLLKRVRLGEYRCAVRISEFEPSTTALLLAGATTWAWVDYFTHFPLTHDMATQLQRAGYKLCLVSPELQGHDPSSTIPSFQALLRSLGITPAAICTKYLELWANFP